MTNKQTVVPDPMAHQRMGAQDGALQQEIDLVAVKMTDTGRVRPHNEDFTDLFVPADPQVRAQKGAIYLVADGMGGHQAGEVASQGAVKLVIQHYYADPSPDVAKSLVRAVQAANQQLHTQAQADPSKSGMGTTLVAAVILGRKVYMANVGDSRAYLINRTTITQITEDHSWVEEQVRAGLLTEEQAKRHPQRNLVTRALGSRPAVDVDLFEGVLTQGDALLLCSDGLSGRVEDSEIAAMVRDHPPHEAAQRLVAAANERGGSDNITVLIVSTEREAAAPVTVPPRVDAERESALRPWLIPALVGGVALVALVLGLLWATGTLFGGKATETPTVSVAAATETPTAEALPTGDMGASPLQTPSAISDETGAAATATLAPTLEETPTTTPTETPTSRAVASPTPRPTAGGTISLESPQPLANLNGEQTFVWSYAGTLGPTQVFQVVIWKQGDTSFYGAAEGVTETRQKLNLDAVDRLVDGGSGAYLWSVVVIATTGTPQVRIGPDDPQRPFTYLGAVQSPTPTSTPSRTPSPTTLTMPTKVPPSDTPVTPTDTPDIPTPEPPTDTPAPVVSEIPDLP